jgi:preprotein translocase subunit SecD
MNKNFLPKLGAIIAVLIIFLFGIFGIPKSFSGQGLLAAMTDHIHLGLDLKGGTHLILQVKVNDAVNVDAQNAIEVLKDQLRSRKVDFTEISQPDQQNNPDHIVLKGIQAGARQDLLSIVSDRLPEYDVTGGANNTWTMSMKPQMLSDLKNRAVTQAIETIRNRIDSLGVVDPTIQEHGLGQYQILVQLPGIDDQGRVKDLIQNTAMLEIKQVLGGPYPNQQAALQAQQTPGILPVDAMLIQGNTLARAEGEQWFLVSRVSAISGKDLRHAAVGTDQNGQPDVDFQLTNEGGQRFYSFTSAHIKDSLGVILDGKVREVASINDAIRDQVQISGHMDSQSAKDLAMILNSGALPASIIYLNEEVVGASLGADSIRAGVRAAAFGMLAVLAFMLIYYRGAGINADIALILNLIILLGFMGYFEAVLTLPGIAGVILTVGMGVDSNVLIFERIREELRNGKTPPSAVDQGFSHAWITIVDTHVTTIVSALILFLFGTGPVKGFAVTLTFGLLANLFTAVFVSRFIFDWILSRKERGEALSI